MESAACLSCGEMVTGKFCSHCGEKRLRDEDKSILHFFGEFMHMFTHADSRFLRSLKYLFTKPGFLTAEHLAGRRKLYTSPLTLFFIANVIYLLIASTDVLNSQYRTQTRGQLYSSWIADKGERKMEQRGWTEEEMAQRYNAKSSSVSKLTLVLLVFLLSLPLALVFYSRSAYFFDHLVFAAEFVSFMIIVVFETIPWVLFVLANLWKLVTGSALGLNLNSPWAYALMFSLMYLFIVLGAKRVYRQKYLVLKSVLYLVCAVVMALLYRYIQFHITMAIV
jgi:hypothetical protein